ncbi:hypothetical protein [Vibrio phage VP16T]|nr:hypothetical protein [Vibrio phage VP16T]
MRNTLRLLLPRGRAWRTTLDKPLRKFMDALGDTFGGVRDHLGSAYTDLLPQYTRRLDDWERQFGLPTVNISDEDRRQRLEAAWRPIDGQGIDTLQDVLQASGFNVYFHNWWVPGSEPVPGSNALPTIRNPADFLSLNEARVNCGEPLAQCGEPTAQAGNSLQTPPTPQGRLLVNIIQTDTGQVEYAIPTDPAEFPHIIYVGGEEFGTYAAVPFERREEFEALILRIRPAHKWVGLLINYT